MDLQGLDADQIRASLGRRVRALRTSRNWTQADLLERFGTAGHPMSQPTLGRLESGTRDAGITELAALARIFDMSIGELVGPVDDAAGLGPSPVVQQLGDVEGQGEDLAAKIEAIEGRMKATVDAVELMRQAIMATQGPAFMEAFRLAATEQGPAFMKAFRLAQPDAEDVEELEGGADV